MTSKSNYRILFATNISSLSNCLSLFLILLFDSNPQRIWKKELGRKWFLHLASSFRTSLCCCLGMPILFLLTKWNSSWLGGITRPRWRCCDCKMTCHFLLGHFGTFYFEKSVTFFVSNPDADDLNKFEICITALLRNSPLRLVKTRHMTCNIETWPSSINFSNYYKIFPTTKSEIYIL